ncbi:antigen 5 like allergen Cul n 1-like [Malaya genurostris]|uniref:antigen 5 like allergen Cul n 1-like n=1 Tax=Malaya genurostris TaxID=325434 RepID=UPI0026F3B9C7|nr:antigen 5 like allergen Cul n 1-like [Malaya genurostris]
MQISVGRLALLMVVSCLGLSLSAVDYCDPELCGNGRPHIGCNATEDFGEACPPNTELIPMDDKTKELIMNLHNSLRSELASGKLEGFESAERMAVLEWNDELAKLAEYNTRTCLYTHDECRSTEKYHFAGQNIARKSKPNNITVEVVLALSDLTNKWWQEYVDTNQTVMDSYRKVGEGVHIGHFALMANDRITQVGCSAAKYFNPDNKRNYVYYVCNYSFTTVLGKPVYRKGKPCSKCSDNCSKKYPGLCEGIGDTIDKELL